MCYMQVGQALCRLCQGLSKAAADKVWCMKQIWGVRGLGPGTTGSLKQ